MFARISSHVREYRRPSAIGGYFMSNGRCAVMNGRIREPFCQPSRLTVWHCLCHRGIQSHGQGVRGIVGRRPASRERANHCPPQRLSGSSHPSRHGRSRVLPERSAKMTVALSDSKVSSRLAPRCWRDELSRQHFATAGCSQPCRSGTRRHLLFEHRSSPGL
jgi:hypothetical protein